MLSPWCRTSLHRRWCVDRARFGSLQRRDVGYITVSLVGNLWTCHLVLRLILNPPDRLLYQLWLELKLDLAWGTKSSFPWFLYGLGL